MILQPSAHVIALVLLILLTTGETRAAGRNILLLIADDLGIDAAEFYPLSERRTTTPPAPPMPNLKRLAQKGVLFRHVWANSVC